jgi:hypothetical protein
MKVSELTEKLISQGCNKNNFAILSTADDAYCLKMKGNEWIIVYSERGSDSEPIYKSNSEEDASEYFYNYILKQEHLHIVGFFKDQTKAKKLELKLKAIGINPVRNDIPAYKEANDPRFRVFVVGKDIFKAREQLGKISINYA